MSPTINAGVGGDLRINQKIILTTSLMEIATIELSNEVSIIIPLLTKSGGWGPNLVASQPLGVKCLVGAPGLAVHSYSVIIDAEAARCLFTGIIKASQIATSSSSFSDLTKGKSRGWVAEERM